MLLEMLEDKLYQLIRETLSLYTTDIASEDYNKIFNACFSLNDVLVKNRSNDYIDGHDLKSKSAVELMKKLCLVVSEEEYDWEIDCLQSAVLTGGRLREAKELVDDYFKTKHGMLEVIEGSDFYRTYSHIFS